MMKFRCERDVLVKALATASRATVRVPSSRAGIRVELQGDTLTLTGRGSTTRSNRGELIISVTVRDRVNGSGNGVAVLPARQTAKAVKSLPAGEVRVEVDGEQARIIGCQSEFTVKVMTMFHRLPDPTGDGVTLDAAELATALRQVVPVASSDDIRPVLTGVLVMAEAGGLRLVATDSYRLAVRDLPGWDVLDAGQSIIIPALALDNLARVLADVDTVTMRWSEGDVSFDAGPVRLTTSPIEGDFPAYKGLIPSGYPNRLTVDRKTLFDAVRRMKPFVSGAVPVRFATTGARLDLVVSHEGIVRTSEGFDDVEHEGDEITVAFDHEYLLDGLKAVPGDEVLIETVDSLNPALISSPGHPEFLYLLMPVRLRP